MPARQLRPAAGLYARGRRRVRPARLVVGGGPSLFAPRAVGERVVVSSELADTLSVIDTRSGRIIARSLPDTALRLPNSRLFKETSEFVDQPIMPRSRNIRKPTKNIDVPSVVSPDSCASTSNSSVTR